MLNHDLMVEFTNESLFRTVRPSIEYIIEFYHEDNVLVCEAWYFAKDMVEKIFDSPYPEHMVLYQMNELSVRYDLSYEMIEIVYFAAWCMMHYTNEFSNNKYEQALIVFHTYISKNYHNQSAAVFYKTIDVIRENIKNKNIVFDYDYTKGQSKLEEDNSCNEENAQDYDALLQEKDQKIKELEEKLAVYEKDDIFDKPHDKVRLETMCKLLEDSGADFKKYGNKAKAARLVHYLTGISKSACSNYMTSRVLSTTEHAEEIYSININLLQLGVKWQL